MKTNVYVIVIGRYPDQFQPACVAGNWEIALHQAEKYVNEKNEEIKRRNDDLIKQYKGNIEDYFLEKPLKKRSTLQGRWDNDLDLIEIRQMEVISEKS